MSVRRVALALFAAVLGAALVCAAPAGAGKAQRKTVDVFDNYYAPAKLVVKAGAKVTWKWPSLSGDIHDVKLKKGPRGVKPFASEPAATDYSYSRTFKVKGVYTIICTLHEDAPMQMTIKVK